MAVIVADSPSLTDVQAAIDAAADGDIVEVPAGSATWTSFLTVNDVRLRGAGASDSGTVITINAGTNIIRHPLELSGFKFILLAGDELVNTAQTDMRIHHNDFDNQTGGSRTIIYAANGDPHPDGVVDHNVFIKGRILVIPDLSGGDGVWHEASVIGEGTGQLVVEDNYFDNTGGAAVNAIDTNSGGRYTFRRNTVINSLCEAHSLQGSGSDRGSRSWEIYENHFITTTSIFAAIFVRAGTGVIYDNVIEGLYSIGIAIDNIRSYDTVFGAPPCDGNDERDGNTVGENGWPCRDQIGRGVDAGVFPSAQASEPAYFWNNTLNGVLFDPTVHNCTSAVKPNGSCADIVEGRDYFAESVRPGYEPYQYPHELVEPVSEDPEEDPEDPPDPPDPEEPPEPEPTPEPEPPIHEEPTPAETCDLYTERQCLDPDLVLERPCAAGCETIAHLTPLSTECPPTIEGETGDPFTATLTATGGVEPYTFELTDPPFDGVTLDGDELSGNLPEVAGVYPFTFEVTDAAGQTASATCQILVEAEPPPEPPGFACGAFEGFQWRRNSRVGPFFSPAIPGVVCFIGVSNSAEKLVAWRSTDYGETWVIADDTYPTLDTIESYDCHQTGLLMDGDDVLVITHENGGRIATGRFDMSAGSWTRQDTEVSDASVNSGSGFEDYGVSISEMSDGSLVIQYDGAKVSSLNATYFQISEDDGTSWTSPQVLGEAGTKANVSARVISGPNKVLLFLFGNSGTPFFGHYFGQIRKSDGTLGSVFQWAEGGSLSQIQTGRFVGDYCTFSESGDFKVALPLRRLESVALAIFILSDSTSSPSLGTTFPTGGPLTYLATTSARCPQASLAHDGTALHLFGNHYNASTVPAQLWHKSAIAPYTSWTPTGQKDDQAGPLFDEHFPGQEIAAGIHVDSNGDVFGVTLVSSNQYNLGLLYNYENVEDYPSDQTVSELAESCESIEVEE